jgi:hypothetical protein
MRRSRAAIDPCERREIVTKLTRRHVHQRPRLAGRPPSNVVFCNGAGVDSMALLHLWCSYPESRNFAPDELLVITAIISSSTQT